jgi:hypothetical protein
VKDSEKQVVTCVKLPVSTPESIAAWRASRGLTGVAEPLPDGLRRDPNYRRSGRKGPMTTRGWTR